jgi:predicted nucleic acid-binding protein
MKPLVVDASAGLAIILNESTRAEVERVLGAHDGPLLAPTSFWLEVVNALAGRHHFDTAGILEAVRELEELEIDAVETDRLLRMMVIDRVERDRLSAYDAAYVVLAELSGGRLLTTDRDQARAAGSRAVFVDPEGRIAEPPPPYAVEPTWPTWRGAAAYLGELRRQAAEELAAGS